MTNSTASDYLRRQAELCVALSRATIDLSVAGRLRAMAEDLRATAAAWDDELNEFSSGNARSDAFAGR